VENFATAKRGARREGFLYPKCCTACTLSPRTISSSTVRSGTLGKSFNCLRRLRLCRRPARYRTASGEREGEEAETRESVICERLVPSRCNCNVIAINTAYSMVHYDDDETRKRASSLLRLTLAFVGRIEEFWIVIIPRPSLLRLTSPLSRVELVHIHA